MQIWNCSNCGQTVYFDNARCLRCGATLGFLGAHLKLTAVRQHGDHWRELDHSSGETWRFCSNRTRGVCNWMVPAGGADSLCQACQLNRTIPDLGNDVHRQLWGRLEAEKHRLVYALLRLGLPVESKQQNAATGLAFDFLADLTPNFREGGGVVTGHAGGVITLNIAEADDAVRERMRQQMAEPYRTILGHFRHESGHYYWDLLVRDTNWLPAFRAAFGDEREDYAAALERHYGSPRNGQWQSRFVSHYASCHPWEDWAESWAHYLHIVDTLETAWQFGMQTRPKVEAPEDMSLNRLQDPCRATDFDGLLDAWLPLTHALNSLNRSMGQPDAYPFVLSPPAIDKLAMVHRVIRSAA